MANAYLVDQVIGNLDRGVAEILAIIENLVAVILTADVRASERGMALRFTSSAQVGERSYFEGLNQNFKLRDAVLYERQPA